jgi:hypothetical protein
MGPSPQKLATGAENLEYQVMMLRATSSMLEKQMYPAGILRNAIMESWAVHARVLLNFLSSESTHYDDVLAVHFFADRARWTGLPAQVLDNLGRVSRTVGIEMAHLGYARGHVVPDQDQWPYADLTRELNEALALFAAAADLLDERLKAYLSQPRP